MNNNSSNNSSKAVKVIYLQDNPKDVIELKDIFIELKIYYSFTVVLDKLDLINKIDGETDLVIIDARLIDDIKDFSDIIKNKYNNISIIIITEFFGISQIEAYYREGVSYVITKPLKSNIVNILLKSLDYIWTVKLQQN